MSPFAQSLPDGPSGRLMAIGLTVAALGALWFGVASPLISWYDAGTEVLAERIVVAQHMQAMVASLPTLRQQAEALQTPAGVAGELLQGGSDSLAGADLQQKLRDIAQAEGAVINSSEALPAEPMAGFVRIGLRVVLEAPFPVLMHILSNISQSRPHLLVDDLRLHASKAGLIEATFATYAIRSGGVRETPK